MKKKNIERRELSGEQKALVLKTVKAERINVDAVVMDRLYEQLPNRRIKPATIAFLLGIDPQIIYNLRKDIKKALQN